MKEILKELAPLNDKCAVFIDNSRTKMVVRSVLDCKTGLRQHTPWTTREEAQAVVDKYAPFWQR
tara:strand:- start:7374 stop:7565 length:192 start_codon:yes stop_codon:yes gene_type:complete